MPRRASSRRESDETRTRPPRRPCVPAPQRWVPRVPKGYRRDTRRATSGTRSYCCAPKRGPFGTRKQLQDVPDEQSVRQTITRAGGHSKSGDGSSHPYPFCSLRLALRGKQRMRAFAVTDSVASAAFLLVALLMLAPAASLNAGAALMTSAAVAALACPAASPFGTQRTSPRAACDTQPMYRDSTLARATGSCLKASCRRWSRTGSPSTVKLTTKLSTRPTCRSSLTR